MQLHTLKYTFRLHDQIINIRNNIKMYKNADAFVLYNLLSYEFTFSQMFPTMLKPKEICHCMQGNGAFYWLACCFKSQVTTKWSESEKGSR